MAESSGRLLPQVTERNEFFWTSGADGTLRIQRCTDCKAFVHPPAPLCPVCRSRNWEPAVVSGRATVVALTINQHQWHPSFVPPYNIALVYACLGEAGLALKCLEHAYATRDVRLAFLAVEPKWTSCGRILNSRIYCKGSRCHPR